MLKCYIDGRNVVGGRETRYNVAEGAVFKENYNETLDSGLIILPQVKEKMDIEPYDIAVVFSTDDSKCKINQKRMCVDTVVCTQTSLDPAIYKYEISLFSETKLLEGILCPSLSITKLLGQSARKVKAYLHRYVDEYGTKKSSSAENGAYGAKFTFGANINDPSDTVDKRFGAVDCPEMQWNEPTLREVLTDLMMVDDCIPVVRNNVIDFIDISEAGSEITPEQRKSINYIQESQSSQDYVSELKMKLVNVANNSIPSGSYETADDADLPKDATAICEKIGFRSNDHYIITDESANVETNFPIWKLFYVKAIVQVEVTVNGEVAGQSVPVTVNVPEGIVLLSSTKNFVLEYGEWQTKPITYAGFDNTKPLSSDYQNTCLYYKRGSKGIWNFNAKQEKQFLWISSQVAIYELIAHEAQVNDPDFKQKAIDAAYAKMGAGWNYTGISKDVNADFKNFQFEVVYEPIDDCTFFASKSPFARNRRQVVDNQGNSYVDIQRQGMLEYLKAKRLGNKIKLINGRYGTDEEDMPKLSQKINDSIIFSKEIAVSENFIKVNYQATENYVMKDYFTSVKSKIRSWAVVSSDEALLRADLIKFYVNGSIPSVSNESRIIPSYPTIEEYLTKFKYCAVVFSTSSGYQPRNATVFYGKGTFDIDRYLVEFSKHKCGNSVLFTIKMADNTFLGKYVSDRDGTGGEYQQNASYTDINGEHNGGVIYFFNTLDPIVPGADEYISSALKPGINHSQMGGIVAKIPFNFYKDQKEITQITVQFEINDEANNMFLGKVD